MENTIYADCKKILIFRLGSLGDTIVGLPAFKLVARAFPNAERVLLTNFSVSSKAAPIAEILENTNLIQKYIEYPVGLRSFQSLLKLIRRIRKLKVDSLIYLAEPRGALKTLRDALFFRMCGVKKIIGIPLQESMQRRKSLGNGLFEYEGSRLLRCLKPLGNFSLNESGAFNLQLTQKEINKALEILQRPKKNKPFFVCSIGAKIDVKDWGDKNWHSLFAQLPKKFRDYDLVMIGSSDEFARTSHLLKCWDGNYLNLCGQLNVRESAALLSLASLFIGHDSGPMHLAAAVGTPCVAIFSSRNYPGEWFPHGSQHKILYRQIDCMGCMLEICEDKNKACIRSITPTMVIEKVIEVIEHR